MDKIKITYLISSLCNEGPVNVLYNTIQYIDFNCFDINIITLSPEKNNSRLIEFKKFHLTIYQLGNNKNTISKFNELKKLIKTIQPDIIHSHCSRSLYYMSFLKGTLKKAYTIHIYPGKQQKIILGSFKGRLVVFLNNYFARRCNMPIACAQSVADLYKENKKWDIVAVPNGSSLPIWSHDQTEKDSLRQQLGLKKEIIYFIFIGRFSAEKHPDFLINSFKKMNNKNIGLILLGSGPMWENLKKEEDVNIILPGFTTNVYNYLKVSDFYVSSSEVEGLANTVLESMTAGLPMLLSDIPSHYEILNKTDSQIGFIFKKNNYESFYSSLQLLLTLPYTITANEVRKCYQENFTAILMSKRYQDLYKKI